MKADRPISIKEKLFLSFLMFSVELVFTLALTSALSPRRGRVYHVAEKFLDLHCSRNSMSLAVRHKITQPIAQLKTRRTIPPLLGERAGVRADVSLIL